jgi:hypothetical protein
MVPASLQAQCPSSSSTTRRRRALMDVRSDGQSFATLAANNIRRAITLWG